MANWYIITVFFLTKLSFYLPFYSTFMSANIIQSIMLGSNLSKKLWPYPWVFCRIPFRIDSLIISIVANNYSVIYIFGQLNFYYFPPNITLQSKNFLPNSWTLEDSQTLLKFSLLPDPYLIDWNRQKMFFSIVSKRWLKKNFQAFAKQSMRKKHFGKFSMKSSVTTFLSIQIKYIFQVDI